MKAKAKILIVLAIVCLFAVIGIQAVERDENAAAVTSAADYLHELCDAFTDDIYLYGQPHTEANNILNYEKYLTARFATDDLHNTDAAVSDELIAKIVPIELFEAKPTDFLHIGKAYGFYFGYISADDTYLIYLLRHTLAVSSSSSFTRRLTPIYYEKYTYDATGGRIALEYVTEKVRGDTQTYYRKFSDRHNLYVKDVAFAGELNNAFHPNQSDGGYDPHGDHGGYFFGNYYRFKSVRTDTSEFTGKLKTALGQTQNTAASESATDEPTLIGPSVGFFADGQKEFGEKLTNERYYGFGPDEIEFAPGVQLGNYGHLVRNSIASMRTDTDADAVLLGVGGNSYAENMLRTMYTDSDDRWNTLFAGTVSLSIVEADNRMKLTTLAADVVSNVYLHEFDHGEKVEIYENETADLYILGNARQHVKFVAPVNGIFTIQTSGTTAIDISASKGDIANVDEYNEKLTVYLKSGEDFDFYVSKEQLLGSRTYKMSAIFTPEKITIGDTKTLVVAPGETEYLEFSVHKAAPYDIFASGADNFRVDIREENRMTSGGESIRDGNTSASNYALANSKYYIVVHNGDSVAREIKLELKNVRVIGFGHDEQETVTRQQYFGLTANVSCGVWIEINGDDLFALELYDTDKKMLDWADGISRKEISYELEKDTLYYILVIRKGITDPNVRLTVRQDVGAIAF